MNKNVTAFILLIIAGGIYFTVTSGMIADAQAVKAVNDQYSSALSDASKLVATRDRVRDQYNAISVEDRDKLDKMIPSAVDNIRLILDLNSIALQHGFSLVNIKAVAAANPAKTAGSVAVPPPVAANGAAPVLTAASFAAPSLDTVTVTFGATADYNQFSSFLQDVEANLRIMDVAHLSAKVNEAGLYVFQVQLKTYWLRQ